MTVIKVKAVVTGLKMTGDKDSILQASKVTPAQALMN
jgi:hypothetical protein